MKIDFLCQRWNLKPSEVADEDLRMMRVLDLLMEAGIVGGRDHAAAVSDRPAGPDLGQYVSAVGVSPEVGVSAGMETFG